VALGFGSMFLLKFQYKEIDNKLQSLEQNYTEEKREEVVKYWDKTHKIMCMFVRSNIITDINSELSRLDEDSVGSLREQFKWLYESEMPYLHNIL
jgi:hypothetical protein